MQFTKPMIELVFQIRSFSPANLKPSIKLANPELFNELRDYFHSGANTVSKALIKELFALTGDNWAQQLENPKQNLPPQAVKVYRGQVSHESKPDTNSATKAQIKKRVYRGQIVA